MHTDVEKTDCRGGLSFAQFDTVVQCVWLGPTYYLLYQCMCLFPFQILSRFCGRLCQLITEDLVDWFAMATQ